MFNITQIIQYICLKYNTNKITIVSFIIENEKLQKFIPNYYEYYCLDEVYNAASVERSEFRIDMNDEQIYIIYTGHLAQANLPEVLKSLL